MKPMPALFALVFAAGLAACGPQSPEPNDAAMSPPATEEAETPAMTQTPMSVDDPARSDSWQLTPLTPATNEIYCHLRKADDGGADAAGETGELLFITEIAGVPAPAAVALNGGTVALEQVSKDARDGIEKWVYENAGRDFGVELILTEVGEGFESRDYEGTIQVTRPVLGTPVPVKGTCGV